MTVAPVYTPYADMIEQLKPDVAKVHTMFNLSTFEALTVVLQVKAIAEAENRFYNQPGCSPNMPLHTLGA